MAPLSVSVPRFAVNFWLSRLPLPMGRQLIRAPVTPVVSHLTFTWPFADEALRKVTDAAAATFVGTDPLGVTGEAPGERSDVPTRFVAVTVTL